MTEKPFYFEEEQDALDIKAEIVKYIRFWPWFLGTTLVCLILAFAYLKVTPVTYQTTAKIKILDETSKGLELPSDLNSLFGNSKVNLENEVEVLKSYRILEGVVKDLDLAVRCYDADALRPVELWPSPFEIVFTDVLRREAEGQSYLVSINSTGYAIIDELSGQKWKTAGYTVLAAEDTQPFAICAAGGFDLSAYVGHQFRIQRSSIYSSVMSLVKELEITTVGKKSEILALGVKGFNRMRSEALLNNIIKQFNQDGINDRQLISQRTLDFVDERFVFLTKELDSIEDGKRDYKQANSLSYIEGDAQYTIEKKAGSEQEQLRMETQRALADLLQETLSAGKPFSLLPSNIGLENSSINQQVGDYNTLVLEREKILKSAGENNPSVKIVSSQLEDVRANILLSASVYQKQLEVSLRQVSAVKRQSAQLFSSIPEKEKILRAIERQQTIKESLYILLLQKREEAAINLAITAPSIKVLDYAITSLTPVGPKKKIIYLGALLLGVLLPFGVLYLRFLLDTKIHSKSDVETLSPESTVIAEVPEITEEQRLVTLNDHSVLAEAFRIVSTNINYLLPITDATAAKVIYVTSTVKGEGKTFTSLNLALTYASMKKKVLLIGADLRNPQLHSYVNIAKNSQGLSNYLYQSDNDWRESIVDGAFGEVHVDVLFSGAIPPNSAELLSNGCFEVLLDEAKMLYDYIIVDTAPMMLVTDTLLISQHADVTLYVVRADYTEKKLLEFSKKLKAEGKLKNMAYVVNNVDVRSSYGYGYNYGYGYGYSEIDEKKPWFKRFFKK
ncbi:MAG: GumC family protein, partial [Flavobacteriaceae bacterium]